MIAPAPTGPVAPADAGPVTPIDGRPVPGAEVGPVPAARRPVRWGLWNQARPIATAEARAIGPAGAIPSTNTRQVAAADPGRVAAAGTGPAGAIPRADVRPVPAARRPVRSCLGNQAGQSYGCLIWTATGRRGKGRGRCRGVRSTTAAASLAATAASLREPVKRQ